MASSKEMAALTSPFFPHIFIQNQFRTTPKKIPEDTDLAGKVAIVTGANQGLGFEASDQLLSLRLARLIIAVRSVSKGEEAAETLRRKYPQATVDVVQLDMSSYDSILAFAAQVEKQPRLDIAILNAGIRKTKFEAVAGTGHEETIQVNYISTALLCLLLLPTLKQKATGGPGRISMIGSGLAYQAKFRTQKHSPLLPSFDEASNFDVLDQYNTSKLLNMMFLYKLTEYVSADDVIINVVDPGFVKGTSLSRDLSLVTWALLTAWKFVAARSLEVGASTYVDAAVVKGRESHGCFIMSWEISPFEALLYTPEGQSIVERLWQETLSELSFAKVESIFERLKKL